MHKVRARLIRYSVTLQAVAQSERLKKLFYAFKKAIEAEHEAQLMYKETISLCEDDEECRNVLEGFLQDEVNREKELMIQYKRLREKHCVTDDT